MSRPAETIHRGRAAQPRRPVGRLRLSEVLQGASLRFGRCEDDVHKHDQMALGKRRVKRYLGKRNAQSEGTYGGVPNLRAWGGQVRAARGHLEIRVLQL